MSSSIELINPKAESVRRAAALQVSPDHPSFLGKQAESSLRVGEHERRDGPRERRQRQSGCVHRVLSHLSSLNDHLRPARNSENAG